MATWATGSRRKRMRSRLKEFIKRPQVTQFDRLRVDGYIDWRKGDLDSTFLKFKAANDIKMDSSLVLIYTQALIAKGRFEEADKLAMDLIAKNKDFGPIYDVLYVEYIRRNLPAEAEKIRRLKADNNPKNLEFRFQLAAHYYLLTGRMRPLASSKPCSPTSRPFPNAREKAGDFYLMFRQFDKALAYYRGGLNGSKEDWLTFQRKIADTLIAQGRRDEALALVENQILKQYPKDPVALALRATLWLEMGNPLQLQQALTELETSASRLPQNAVVRFNLGRAYFARFEAKGNVGDLDQARTQFKAAVGSPAGLPCSPAGAHRDPLAEGRVPVGPSVCRRNPRLTRRAIFRPGCSALRLCRASASWTTHAMSSRPLLKQYPNSVEAMFRLGLLELSAKNYPAAARTFEQCMKNSTNNYPCVVGAAEVYSKQKQFDKAIEFLSAELKKNPDRRELRLDTLLAGNTTALAGKYEAAAGRSTARCSAKEPESADLHLRLAETSRLMGKTEVAIEHFRRVQQLQPKNPDAAVWLALLLHQTGREAEAKQHYLEVLQIQPDNPVALNNLAFVIAEQGGDLDVALTYAQRAKQKAPQSDEISDTLAWIYLKKKLTPNALAIYDGLVARQPKNTTFRYHRGHDPAPEGGQGSGEEGVSDGPAQQAQAGRASEDQ